jgi:hypothetical protein
MKILSKYKDYYDYLIGVFGEDSKLILDRRGGGNKFTLNDGEVIIVCIGNKRIEGIYKDDNFYYGSGLKKFHNESKISLWGLKSWGRKYDNTKDIIYTYSYFKHSIDFILSKVILNTTLNSENNCAILMYRLDYKGELSELIRFPILKDINIPSILSARDTWIILNDYLSSQIKEPVVPIGDNNIRIQSHGFDLKTSFRPKIK